MKAIAALFPGQGSQAVGMGKSFRDRSTEAKELFDRADGILGYEISRIAFEGPEDKLRLTENTQPALLIVSVAAFRLSGLEPAVGAGHSLGEYSALVAAGALDFEDAVLLVHKRGRFMQEAVPVGTGAMAAVLGLAREKIEEGLSKVGSGVVEAANWNGEEQTVIAGHKEAVEEALGLLRAPRSVMLPVSAPFHTRLMRPAEVRLSAELDKVVFRDPAFPIITNVDARLIRTGEEARDALKRQVSRAVLWTSTMEVLRGMNLRAAVELGSGRVLSGLLRRAARSWSAAPAVFNVEDWEGLEKTKEALSGLF
jgi:[acyl-carrier-protein] S-malonyltransferase